MKLFALAVAAVAGAFGGYFYANHGAEREAIQTFYSERAQTARVDALILTTLRSGGADKAIQLVSGLLEGELTSLNFYERDLSPAKRSPKVYEDIAAVRTYYDRFPDAERPTYGKKSGPRKFEQRDRWNFCSMRR